MTIAPNQVTVLLREWSDVDQPRIQWESRAHFFGIAARLMRRILVDDARKRNSVKRGGRLIQVPLGEVKNLVGRRIV